MRYHRSPIEDTIHHAASLVLMLVLVRYQDRCV
nr:MAG TPA: hypothetical protein [Caudoviricetes sp.]